jgi:hypothetical protein
MANGELELLLDSLSGDRRRIDQGFSDDIKVACEVLLNPFASTEQSKEAIYAWLSKFQPCLFGRIAAKDRKIFISLVDENLIKKGDDAVKAKIINDKKKWKHWSASATFEHSFLLLVISTRLFNAEPNRAMELLAQRFESLVAIENSIDPEGNRISNEWLYLKHPSTHRFYKFRVNLDFFSSAGDKRWWHDHRIPGGFAFTLNSLGHMARYREWYGTDTDPSTWAAKTAMMTIQAAFNHPSFGKATNLLDLKDGKPLKSARCPFSNVQSIP